MKQKNISVWMMSAALIASLSGSVAFAKPPEIHVSGVDATSLLAIAKQYGSEIDTGAANMHVSYEMQSLDCYNWMMPPKGAECKTGNGTALSAAHATQLVEILQRVGAPVSGHMSGIGYPVVLLSCASVTGDVPVYTDLCTLIPGATWTNPAE